MTLSEEQIQDILRVGNPTDEERRLIRMGWDAAIARMRTKSVPEGWLRAIDEALVTAHIGVANAHDTYEQAKVKLGSLIGFHVDVATDPAVNGGFKLVPIDVVEQAVNRFLSWKLPKDFHPDGGMVFIPTKGRGYDSPHWPVGTNLLNAQQAREMLLYVLAAAPEAKP